MNVPSPDAASRLCAACGLCCDGTLFHAVVLQAGDSARALAARGLKIKRRRGQAYFHQPCRAHAECRCAIYEQRPARCRLFACRQLRAVEAGEISESAARETIRAARGRVAEVHALLARVAETNPARALAARCANALAGSADPAVEPLRRELAAAQAALEAQLVRDFRVEPAVSEISP